ncbi:hypothetical protein HRR80_002375 [Exophiala dermatitidis]|uniref:Uncharacterized protein n=1 Tax=Exophiala dermatitidis TaxID=5970 RepID=A0AAN6IX22_EXODE|nr:hypothetical protein HRR80_002375 [Exophiala dermatitidis]
MTNSFCDHREGTIYHGPETHKGGWPHQETRKASSTRVLTLAACSDTLTALTSRGWPDINHRNSKIEEKTGNQREKEGSLLVLSEVFMFFCGLSVFCFFMSTTPEVTPFGKSRLSTIHPTRVVDVNGNIKVNIAKHNPP